MHDARDRFRLRSPDRAGALGGDDTGGARGGHADRYRRGFAGIAKGDIPFHLSSHAESIANTKTKEEEQPDAEDGLEGQEDFKTTGQLLEHARTDQIPADTEYAKRVGEAKTDGPASKAVIGKRRRAQPPPKFTRIRTAPKMPIMTRKTNGRMKLRP